MKQIFTRSTQIYQPCSFAHALSNTILESFLNNSNWHICLSIAGFSSIENPRQRYKYVCNERLLRINYSHIKYFMLLVGMLWIHRYYPLFLKVILRSNKISKWMSKGSLISCIPQVKKKLVHLHLQMMIQRYARAFVMTLLLLCSLLNHNKNVFNHQWKGQKKGTAAEFKRLLTLPKRRAEQSVEPIVFMRLRVTAKGSGLIKKFCKSGECFLTLCANGTNNVLYPFKRRRKWTIKDKVKVQMRDCICSLW